MVVEHSIRSAQHSFAVAIGIVSHTQAWLNIVLVSLNPFLQAEQMIRRKRQPLRRSERWGYLNVVAYSIVQRKSRTHPPRILPEGANRGVMERVARAPDTLYEISG